jgi:tRNA (adenine22-N1)-methyltransferase
MTAALVPPGCALADIGSDHAYLPAWLAARGVCCHVIAADVGEGPLRNAAQTLAKLGLGDRVELRQSDGLDAFAPGEADCFLFAGMGGTLIVRLLARGTALFRPGLTIVAQPMSRAAELRGWLWNHGFSIEEERACQDDRRVYGALRAVYDGQARRITPGMPWTGLLPACGDPAAVEILRRTAVHLRTRAAALEADGRDPAEAERLRAALQELESEMTRHGYGT